MILCHYITFSWSSITAVPPIKTKAAFTAHSAKSTSLIVIFVFIIVLFYFYIVNLYIPAERVLFYFLSLVLIFTSYIFSAVSIVSVPIPITVANFQILFFVSVIQYKYHNFCFLYTTNVSNLILPNVKPMLANCY